MTKDKIKSVAKILKAINDPLRLHIIEILRVNPEENVLAITDALNITQPGASFHLRILREKNIVDYRRDGKNNYYSLTPYGRDIAGVLENF